MSSSDDEWRNPPNLVFGRDGGRAGEDAMLAARRRALQRQGGAVGLQPTSSPQAAFQPAFVQQEAAARPSAAAAAPREQMGVTEEMLEALRRELEAKKKLLAAAKEKESSLRDKWRAQKAQRLAEIAQLDGKLRHHQDVMEDVKATAEREVRVAEDEQQQTLKEERSKLELAIREEYEPQIMALRIELEGMQQEEAKLKAELDVGDTAKDLVHKCIGSALATILRRVEDMFAAETTTMEKWNDDIQRLVRHEVRSSFAVTTGSEAQREREDCQKLFQESLEFWRKAEEEEREHILKMDEQLLLDMQSMVHDDLDRLQREELSMEEMYVESREAWASQHQVMLKRELDAAVSRRTAEHEEQRALRHQMHLERLKTIEENHKDMIEKQRWFHEKHMALLREQHAKEEELNERKSRATTAMQADISRATEEFNRIVHAVEDLLKQMKEYRATVEDGHVALNHERQQMLEARQETLKMLQDVVTSQSVSVNEEYNSLLLTQNKLEGVRRTMEQHLEEERLWLGKLEAKFAHGKSEWEREYRRWKQMVEDEKSHVQERFGQVLSELQNASAQLAEEEREAQAEQITMMSWFRASSERTDAEVRQLRQREEELRERREAMTNLLTEMQQKGEEIDHQWRQLRQERQELMKENEVLREDEMQLRQTRQYLQLLKRQIDETRMETAGSNEHLNTLRHELHVSQKAVKDLKGRKGGKPRHVSLSLPSGSRKVLSATAQSSNRLPLRVLHDLQEMLGTKKEYSDMKTTGAATLSTREPATRLLFELSPTDNIQPCHKSSTRHKHRRHQQSHQPRERYVDPVESSKDTSTQLYDSFNNNFTSLINFSDTDSTHQSLHTSSSK